MYERILVPTDGSEQSERATDHALKIASQFGSTIHAIHVARLFGSPVHDIRVVDDQGPDRATEAAGDLSPNSPERKAMEERREEAGNELTDAIVERAREAGLDAHGEVLPGEPADVITEYAQANDMDLIVIGARGRSAVGKFLLGSVAGKVARHATTPVMLVRPDE